MTGACSNSASRANAPDAPERMTPPPAQMTGLSAAANRAAAWSTLAESGASGL